MQSEQYELADNKLKVSCRISRTFQDRPVSPEGSFANI